MLRVLNVDKENRIVWQIDANGHLFIEENVKRISSLVLSIWYDPL